MAPYPGLPAVTVLHNGGYRHEPSGTRNFLYEQERQRGLDVEDLASPGSFTFDLSARDAFMILRAGEGEGDRLPASPEIHGRGLLKAEAARRQRFASPLHRAADAYIVRRGEPFSQDIPGSRTGAGTPSSRSGLLTSRAGSSSHVTS